MSLINGLKHWLDRAKEAGAIADEMKDPDASAAETGVCGASALTPLPADRRYVVARPPEPAPGKRNAPGAKRSLRKAGGGRMFRAWVLAEGLLAEEC